MASSIKCMSKERIVDVKTLRFASDKKFAEVWEKEEDSVWESYL